MFRAEDVDDFVRAVRRCSPTPQRYRAAYDEPESARAAWTWERQAEILDSVYRRLLDADARRCSEAADRAPTEVPDRTQADGRERSRQVVTEPAGPRCAATEPATDRCRPTSR